MRYDLVDLKLFMHIIEAQSITAGAARSHLSLASASARIKGMEETLGTPLLERHRRGVAPTPAGRTLAHHAQTVLHQLGLMNGELGNHATGLRCRIRLLCNTAALTEHLPDLLGRFLLRHPQLDLDIEERSSHQIVEALTRRQSELGLLADNTAFNALESRPFRTDHLVVITAKHLPLPTYEKAVRFESLLAEPFVGLTSTNALQQHLEEKAKHAGKWLTLRARVASLDAVGSLVAQGVGIAVVPEAAYRRSQLKNSLSMVRLQNSWATRLLHLCAYRFDALSPYAAELAEHILDRSNMKPAEG
ncbi:LysR family transcriptional regulator [Pseudomonas asuensis]|uniref:LysR family transcriptional regulator n=1 Tax=Pseudomonas asuensis TaxID=1825787 RepID=A0ABQ2GXB6_9PSED|nr:LysR family transcriptional regulator [Pseudomonas asuensis]GGM18171.1 LysR family transcriptional regulator [Pseudomonas asuensis]